MELVHQLHQLCACLQPTHFVPQAILKLSFTVERGVKQGSVLSPTLFLTVMDQLLTKPMQVLQSMLMT